MSFSANQIEVMDKLTGNLTEDQVKSGVTREDLANQVTIGELADLRQALSKVAVEQDFKTRTGAQQRMDQLGNRIDSLIKVRREQMEKDPSDGNTKSTHEELVRLRDALGEARSNRGVIDSTVGEVMTTVTEIATKGTNAQIDALRLAKTGGVLMGIVGLAMRSFTGVKLAVWGSSMALVDKISALFKDFMPAFILRFMQDPRAAEKREKEAYDKKKAETGPKITAAKNIAGPPPPLTEENKKKVREGIAAVDEELKLLTDITHFPELDRPNLTARKKELEDDRKSLVAKIPEEAVKKEEAEKKTAAVDTLAQTQTLNAVRTTLAALPNGNLMVPVTERIVDGVAVRFGNGKIFLGGRELKIEAQLFGVGPFVNVNINSIQREGNGLRANARALAIPTRPFFTPEELATALTRFKSGSLPFTEPDKDGTGALTGHVRRFSLV